MEERILLEDLELIKLNNSHRLLCDVQLRVVLLHLLIISWENDNIFSAFWEEKNYHF